MCQCARPIIENGEKHYRIIEEICLKMIFNLTPAILVILAVIKSAVSCKCYQKYDGVVEHVIKSKLPHEYLKETDLPKSWDWRNINGTNYCGKVITQVNPNVCGSCWAEAATGALSDRFAIATSGKLRVTLAPQILIKALTLAPLGVLVMVVMISNHMTLFINMALLMIHALHSLVLTGNGALKSLQ